MFIDRDSSEMSFTIVLIDWGELERVIDSMRLNEQKVLLWQQFSVELFNKLAFIVEQFQFIDEVFHDNENWESRGRARSSVVFDHIGDFLHFIHSTPANSWLDVY